MSELTEAQAKLAELELALTASTQDKETAETDVGSRQTTQTEKTKALALTLRARDRANEDAWQAHNLLIQTIHAEADATEARDAQTTLVTKLAAAEAAEEEAPGN